MLIDEKINSLQNLIKRKITYQEIADILGMETANAIRNWKYRKRHLEDYEIAKIDEAFGIEKTKVNKISQSNIACAAEIHTDDVIKIPYWNGLPDNLKHPEYSYVLAQRTSIEKGWGLEADNLCIVPMVGDKMTNYWYPIFNGDILIVDTSQDYIMGNGVYFATSQSNTRFWIREMQVLVNDDVEFKGFAHSGNTTSVLSKQQLDKVGFKVIGRVIKNVSFRL